MAVSLSIIIPAYNVVSYLEDCRPELIKISRFC